MIPELSLFDDYSLSFNFETVIDRLSSTVENPFTLFTKERGQTPRPMTLASIQGFKSETSIHFPAFLIDLIQHLSIGVTL